MNNVHAQPPSLKQDHDHRSGEGWEKIGVSSTCSQQQSTVPVEALHHQARVRGHNHQRETGGVRTDHTIMTPNHPPNPNQPRIFSPHRRADQPVNSSCGAILNPHALRHRNLNPLIIPCRTAFREISCHTCATNKQQRISHRIFGQLSVIPSYYPPWAGMSRMASPAVVRSAPGVGVHSRLAKSSLPR